MAVCVEYTAYLRPRRAQRKDMFNNPTDVSVLDRMVGIFKKERDDYEEYWEKQRKYEL